MLRGNHMATQIYHNYIIYGVIILLLSMSLTPSTMSKPAEQYRFITNHFDGNILFSPMSSTTTYLINYDGEIMHTWPNSNRPGYSVYPLENGNILRAARTNFNPGGMVQEITWSGDIIWEFTYDSNEYLSHHDIEPLPNGNVLMIAWDYKTVAETTAAGHNPILPPGVALTSDHIIEVKPNGSTNGDIVWEWHVWDHLIQDYDPSKNNYGIVADHPELIDINFAGGHSFQISDWTHVNSIDYNENLDQILLSSWFFNEIWVIDHSTTTEEASGHTGGNSGKGGDLLYRWGNPQTYRVGTATDQQLFGQHDPQWIESGCPGAGNILIFNNGLDRPEGKYSSVEEILPPVTPNGNYMHTPSSPYGPENPLWIYTANIPTDFYSSIISGCQRLPNGNTLICNGVNGIFFEVTPEKEIIWEYINPYPSFNQNSVFKICYTPLEQQSDDPDLDCDGSLSWTKVPAGSTQTGTFVVKNIGETSSLLDWEIESQPEWGIWTFTPEEGYDLTPEYGPYTVQVSVVAPDKPNTEFTGEVKIVNKDNSSDFCTIDVSLATPKNRAFNINLLFLRFLEQHPHLFPILRHVLGL